MAVDAAVRPDRVPAPARVAPVAAQVGADAAAEVAQAQDGLEAGVLFAVARAGVVEAAARQARVDIAGERVAVLREDLLAADTVGLGEEGQRDRAVVVVVRAAVLGGQEGPRSRTRWAWISSTYRAIARERTDSPSLGGRWRASIRPPTTQPMAWLPASCGLKKVASVSQRQ